MPPDDVEEFLKFLDDVSLQLACLLDIDGERDLKRIYSKQRMLNNTSAKAKISKSNSSVKSSSSSAQVSKKQQKAAKKQPIRARGRRKTKQDDENQSIDVGVKDHHCAIEQNEVNIMPQQQHHHNQAQNNDLQAMKSLTIGAETHSLEVQLSLGLSDELSIEHGASISPATHLSPMDPSPIGQFNHTIAQQHYYNPTRGSLDSFHLHEEFSSHEPVPIANDTSHQLVVSPEHHHHSLVHHHHHHHHHQQQQQQQQQQHNRHQHQPSQHLHNQHQSQDSVVSQSQPQHLPNSSDANFSTLPSMSDCYSQPPVIHHHGSQHHQHHHHHLHNQQQPHQNSQVHHHQSNLQYQTTLDNQWLNTSSLTGDTNIHILEPHNHNAIDHVVSISPGANQNLDQVQFGSSLYHHSYYGHHQTEHLDPFHQISNDDFGNNSATLASDNNQMHRLQQDQQQQQHTHLNNGDPNNNNRYNQSHIHQSQSDLPNSDATYPTEHQQNLSGHLQSSQHSHPSHHHLTHMPHLVSGIEPSNVIIQDINLAAATWTSSEDLYSI